MRQLTREQAEAYLVRLEQIADARIPVAVRAIAIQLYRNDPVGLLNTVRNLIGALGTDEELMELDKLRRGGEPDETCDACPYRGVCWPDKKQPKTTPIAGNVAAGYLKSVN